MEKRTVTKKNTPFSTGINLEDFKQALVFVLMLCVQTSIINLFFAFFPNPQCQMYEFISSSLQNTKHQQHNTKYKQHCNLILLHRINFDKILFHFLILDSWFVVYSLFTLTFKYESISLSQVSENFENLELDWKQRIEKKDREEKKW